MSPVVKSRASARFSTPTSWRTSARSPTSNRYSGTGRPAYALPHDRFELTYQRPMRLLPQRPRLDCQHATTPPAQSRRRLSSEPSYALCFSSAEDAAEGPSEDEPKPSAVDLVTSAVTTWSRLDPEVPCA